MVNVKPCQEEAEVQATVLLPVVLAIKALANWENFVVQAEHVKVSNLSVNTMKNVLMELD